MPFYLLHDTAIRCNCFIVSSWSWQVEKQHPPRLRHSTWTGHLSGCNSPCTWERQRAGCTRHCNTPHTTRPHSFLRAWVDFRFSSILTTSILLKQTLSCQPFHVWINSLRMRCVCMCIGPALTHLATIQGVSYMLVCPGRIGTRQKDMGIPVQWSDIDSTRCIVETDIQGIDVPPSEGIYPPFTALSHPQFCCQGLTSSRIWSRLGSPTSLCTEQVMEPA